MFIKKSVLFWIQSVFLWLRKTAWRKNGETFAAKGCYGIHSMDSSKYSVGSTIDFVICHFDCWNDLNLAKTQVFAKKRNFQYFFEQDWISIVIRKCRFQVIPIYVSNAVFLFLIYFYVSNVRGGPFFAPEKCLKEFIPTWWACFENPILLQTIFLRTF